MGHPTEASARRIRALIFDFDGTILETEGPDYESWREVYAQHGVSLPVEVWAVAIGGAVGVFDAYAWLEQQAGQPVDRAAIQSMRRARYDELVAGQTVLPGVEAYVRRARALGLKLAIASSSPHSWVDTHLTNLGLYASFDAICCADDVPLAKPSPDLFWAALAALQVDASEAIVIEDSPNGVTAARAAGIYCVVVPHPLTAQLPLDHANLRLDSLADLSLDDLLQHPHLALI